ncbi:MAG TPA: winged helix-turn-helix domain-containing protein [Thermoanaerobaculaceae bacterium]|nr:winged helix-turn-helix domain-containing protein [Thermoanaerobaculaceae bacterium]
MASSEPFRLGDWLVQPSLNRISRGDATAALQPRFMDLLVYLSEHTGKVVSKEEILEAVWAKEFVSEGTLTHAVAVIRQTLGDDVHKPQYVETIPTRGYRVIAPVTPVAPDDGGRASAAQADDAPPARRTRLFVSVAAIVAVAVAALLVWRLLPNLRGAPVGGRAGRIVVLPFRNLGPPARDFVASGISDEITTRLAVAHSVGVVSRTSALYCAKASKPVRQIKEELGADYVLEGTVRTDSSQLGESPILVNVLLIRASDDTSLWAARYRSDLAYIADVSAAIAGRVLEELGVKVAEPERTRLEARPTEDPNAYQAYLCGIRYQDLTSRDQLGLAVAMFERAVTLDPSFALAWAELAVTHARIYHLGIDDTSERLARVQRAAERALSLQPELPEAHLAIGAFYHLAKGDGGRALDEYGIAAKGLPNDSLLFSLIADVHRRQGKWAEARAEIERVVDLDPQNYTALLALGDTLHPMRDYQGADRAFLRAANLSPDRNEPYLRRFWNLLAWEGDTERAEDVLSETPVPNEPEVAFARSYAKYLHRDIRGALDAISLAPANAPMGPFRFAARPLTRCLYFDALGDRAGVERSCGAALETLEAAARKRPGDPHILLEIGQAQAFLGRGAEAVHTAEQAVALFPVARDAYDGPGYILQQARILARVGETGKAVALLERLLSIPSPISVALLRLDPGWDRVRDDHGFEALLREIQPQK